MKTLVNLKMYLKNRNRQQRSRPLRNTRRCAVALIVLAILAPCLLGSREVSASDFNLHIKDDETGDSFFINALTGDYLLFKGAKRSFLAGRGKLTISDCLIELRDSGASAKRPDREVYVAYNLCEGTAKAEGQVFATGESFALSDSQTTDNEPGEISARKEGLEGEITEPIGNIRFQPLCMQDDVQSYLQMNFQNSSVSSAYVFADRSKNIFVEGQGAVVVNGCKMTLTDSGPDPKRPAYRIILEYNRCTFVANAIIWIAATGKTYTLNDSDIRNSNSCLL
jgi:hypothetical protein